MNNKIINTDIIIIGAGPTGLMAACQLARYAIDFIIIDHKSQPTEESRAIAVTARSLEIYQQMGISDTAVDQGQFILEFSMFMDGKEKARVPIGEIGKGLTDFPYLLAFEQSKNEILLNETLQKYQRQVWWETEFLDLEQNSNSVTVQIKKIKEQKEITVKAKYLIGCDGARSPVRHALKSNFAGGTYENKFFVADTKLKWNFSYNHLIVSPAKNNFCGFFPMHPAGTYRVLGSLPKKFYEKEDITFSDLEDVIKNTMKFPLEFTRVNWFSIYKLHHRCVDKFQIGKCFLAGDAAHIHSPAGGQGMNTGLQDAYNLSWKLALVLKESANEKLLETYHTERYPFAQWLLKFTDRAFAVMTSDNYLLGLIRKHIIPHVMKFVLRSKKLRLLIFNTISQIKYSYTESPLSLNLSKQPLKFKAGDRLPYIGTNINNKQQSIYSLLSEPKFYLVVIGSDKLSVEESDCVKNYSEIMNVFLLPLQEDWKKLGVKQKLFIIVRPDIYIGSLSDNINKKYLELYFNKVFSK